MPLILIATIALLVAFVGYATATNPVGCKNFFENALSLAASISPLHVTSGGGTPMAPLLKDHLVLADGSPFNFPTEPSATASSPATPGPAASPLDYYAIYYAAQGSDPQAFTPGLVQWYKKFKPLHHNFELIFVSRDPDKSTMLAFMKATSMPWPAYSFEDLPTDGSGIEKFAGNVLPDFVLVDSDGKVLSDSVSWTGSDLGPQHVVDDIESIVQIPPKPPKPPKPTVTAPPPQLALAYNPDLPPIKLWSPPQPLPAKDNWTWTMSDGTTYQNVVVTEVTPDTVTINHSLGVAHVSIAIVPPDIQRELNYDPDAAACASHPPYSFSDRFVACAMAQQLHRPLAWLAVDPKSLTLSSPPIDSEADLAQMAVAHIKFESIIILIDDPSELDILTPAIHDQFLVSDDGPLPAHQLYATPKIVFSTPDASTFIGRVSFSRMKSDRESAIDTVLTHTVPATLTPPTLAEQNSNEDQSAPVAISGKSWTPPDVLPAQPNWTWTTSEGQTYQNVVVTEVEPDTVSITHANGVAHVPIANLSSDIQKLLNYDPVAAAAFRAEKDREQAHPYYTMSSLKEAQRVARQLDWPLAWICSSLTDMNATNPAADSEEGLTQMAVNELKSRAVIVFLDGNADLPALSPLIRDEQLFQLDDGPLPDGHHFYGPKIVFSDADVTKTFGRVSCTQMKATGSVAIDEIVASIPKDPNGMLTANSPTASAATPGSPTPASPTIAPVPTTPSATPPPNPTANPSTATGKL